MPTRKLTDLFVERVKPPARGRLEYFDASFPALALRVTDRESADDIPTSWAWQWGLAANPVTDFYQRFFTEFRRGLLGAPGDENP